MIYNLIIILIKNKIVNFNNRLIAKIYWIKINKVTAYQANKEIKLKMDWIINQRKIIKLIFNKHSIIKVFMK